MLKAGEGHFYPFEEKNSDLDPQDPLHSCLPNCLVSIMKAL